MLAFLERGNLPLLAYGTVAGSNEDAYKTREALCILGHSNRQSLRKHRVSWLHVLGPFPCTQGIGIHYHHKHFRPNRQTTFLNLVCILPSNVPCTYGNILFLAGSRGRRERHLLRHTSVLLNFKLYEWLKYKNKYKGHASGKRKVVPDGGLDFGKERGAIKREIWVNTNESWLHKTMKLMFKIYREN